MDVGYDLGWYGEDRIMGGILWSNPNGGSGGGGLGNTASDSINAMNPASSNTNNPSLGQKMFTVASELQRYSGSQGAQGLPFSSEQLKSVNQSSTNNPWIQALMKIYGGQGGKNGWNW
jgi:hypothetical protein